MSRSQNNVYSAIEVADLMKQLSKTRDSVAALRDQVFDAINVPFPVVQKVWEQLISAEKSLDAAAVALTRSK